ncbi:hypothetical protein BJF90_01185 [Pseudonocardia sp. CNS-004]|nr:hypothetical protein BJF90_01185 [Pseudonocardia sp. CNS-004]
MLDQFRPAGARRCRIVVIDGPNMPNLGHRSEKIYGPIRSLEDLQALVRRAADGLGVDVVPFASNHGGEILEFIHPRTRAADFGFPYSLSVAIFGGTVSVIGTALEEAGAGGWFGWYLAATAVITLVATCTLRETGGVELEKDAAPG